MADIIANNFNSISSTRDQLTVETTIQCMFYAVMTRCLRDLLWVQDDIGEFMQARGFRLDYNKHHRIAARGRCGWFLLNNYGSLPLYSTEIIKASMYNRNIDNYLRFFNQTRLFQRMHDVDAVLGVAADNAEMDIREFLRLLENALQHLSLNTRNQFNWRA